MLKKQLNIMLLSTIVISNINAATIEKTDTELIELGKEYLLLKEKKLEEEKLKKEQEKIENKRLKIKSQIGFTKTNGNTNTTSFTGLLEINKKIDKNSLNLKTEGQYSEDDGTETKNKISSQFNYGYQCNDKLSFNYVLYYENDKFSGFDYKAYTGPGFIYTMKLNKSQTLNLGGNILYEEDAVQDDDTINYTALKAKLDYKVNISSSLDGYFNIEYRTDVSNTDMFNTIGNIGLESKLNKHFSLGINYKNEYVNVVPADKTNSDDTFTVNLIINY